ncbi:MAG: CRISPR-associated endonuclease Cas2 [Akkermansia sp.]
MMRYLISYDVNTSTPAGQRRLRRVAKACEAHGVRVQNSVFECVLEYAQLLTFREQLGALIDVESDSIRIYPLGKGSDRIIHMGIQKAFDVTAPLIL